MKKIIVFILFIVCANSIYAQSISLYDLDISSFPTIKAKFRAFDKDGNKLSPSVNEIKITENGIERNVSFVSCPKAKPLQNVSVAMSIDVSGSMGFSDAGDIPVDLGKITAEQLCRNIAMPPSDFALQTCDDRSQILQDFTSDRNKIINAISPVRSGGGNDFNEHLLNNLSGLLNVAKKGKNKRVAVLYTDAWWYALSTQEMKSCLDTCNKYNIQFFAVIYSRKDAEPNGIKKSLNELATATGGLMYDGVTSKDAAKDLATLIQSNTQGDIDPCDINWISGNNCTKDKNNIVEIEVAGLKTTAKYTSPASKLAKINISPSYFSFGKIAPNSTKDTVIKLTAINSDIVVSNIKLAFGNGVFTVENTSYPFTISQNTTKQITIRCKAIDSNINYSTFEVVSDQCPTFFSVNSGFPGKKLNVPTLKLTYPNGGEKFVVGTDTAITWEGTGPDEKVSLEYSIDNGKSWKNLSNTAANLSYDWKNISKPTSDICLVKVKQMAGEKSGPADSVLSLIGHEDAITSIAFSPDGTKIVTGSFDATAKIWDAFNGTEIGTLKGHSDIIYSVAFSADGSKIITGSYDNSAKIWNADNFKEIKTLNGHTGVVNSVVISLDGKKIVTGSYDMTAKIWDANTGAEIRTLSGHKDVVLAVAISSDGNTIYTGSYDKDIKQWNANTGALIRTFSGHTDLVNSIALNYDGSRLVSASSDQTVKIWDTKTGNVIRTLTGHTNYVLSVAISLDGNKILSGSLDASAKLWDANTGLEIKTLKGHSFNVSAVAFDWEGNRYATASWDNTAKVYGTTESILQEDISDDVFSIVAPEIKSHDIDMKSCLLGNSKDTLVGDFVSNFGTYGLRVDSIYFRGTDQNAFVVASGIPPYQVEANTNHSIEIRFKPTKVGKHNAEVVIVSQSETLVQKITGEGLAPQLAISNTLIDFGKVKVGKNKDSMQIATIKNIGTSDVEITAIKHKGPNDKDFSTISNIKAFNLKAGETAKVDLRFSPSYKGRTNGMLEFEYNGFGSPAKVQLYGEGISADSNCDGRNFVFNNFSANSKVNLLGKAAFTEDSTVRLTESKLNEIGGISFAEKIALRSSFSMRFSFRFSKGDNYQFIDGSLPGADGIAVLFQNGKNFRVTDKGGSLGYHGIINCVALEVDMYRNQLEYNDPNGNHVALQVPYHDTVSSKHDANRTVKMNENIFEIRPDSTIYYAYINYDAAKKQFDFYLDSNKNTTNLVLSVDNFDFAQYLKLELGDYAFIGITSTTGASSEIHEILSWEFCSERDEFLGIEDDYIESEEISQTSNNLSISDAIIKKVKIFDYLGKMIIDDDINSDSVNLDKYNLSQAVYFVILTDEFERQYFRKIVRSR